MTMPIDLVLVRHGQSEGNVAAHKSREGNHDCYTSAFRERHGSQWRLSDKGVQDAERAGAWLRKNLPRFDRCYTSEYTRALETAARLGLEDALWYREPQLRERDHGHLESIPHPELRTRFAEEIERRARGGLFWRPPGGESMTDVCTRVDRFFDTLHRECSDKRVIVVVHGEVMWAFRLRLERMPQERWLELDASSDLADRIFNGQIIHYTRRDPETNVDAPHLNWMRMVRADDPTFPRGWRPIVRPKFSNQELLNVVERTERLIVG